MVIGTCSKKILVFAGTYEGHRLAKYFCSKGWTGHMADFCVATEYGTEALDHIKGISIIEGRLSEKDMERLIGANGYGYVIDATHPYATDVTKNIQSACEVCQTPYIRLLREECSTSLSKVMEVNTIEEAVSILNQTDERVLLTTGSKEIGRYGGMKNFTSRAFARVLPTIESLKLCEEAGIQSKNIVALQGPFTKEMNLAMMEQYDCKWLVTKNTGKPGGFEDKAILAEAGYKIIVIGRPSKEEGLTYEQVVGKVDKYYGE